MGPSPSSSPNKAYPNKFRARSSSPSVSAPPRLPCPLLLAFRVRSSSPCVPAPPHPAWHRGRREYLGEKFALFFTFHGLYMSMLWIPAIIGAGYSAFRVGYEDRGRNPAMQGVREEPGHRVRETRPCKEREDLGHVRRGRILAM